MLSRKERVPYGIDIAREQQDDQSEWLWEELSRWEKESQSMSILFELYGEYTKNAK